MFRYVDAVGWLIVGSLSVYVCVGGGGGGVLCKFGLSWVCGWGRKYCVSSG